MNNNPTALITGGSSGIGLGIAHEFAAAGYNLVLNGLEENGDEIAAEVGEKYGVKALFSNANLLDPAKIKGLAVFAEENFGTVEVVVNNAGVQYVAPIDEFPQKRWEMILGLNLSAAFYLVQALWPGMKKNNFGRIINIASAHGLRASAFKAAYVSAKHGIVGLTKVMALEGAEFNITANAICPGYVLTPLVESQIADQAKSHNMTEEEVIEKVMLKKHAKKEFVTVEALGQMAVFLASEHASTFTGTAIPIDGGWTAQ
ncbi:MAG: 3-hydroxybutyrate dehydrogenase [Bacteroidota bacterium]